MVDPGQEQGPVLRLDVAEELRGSWVAELVTEVAAARAWTVGGPGADARALVAASGTTAPVDGRVLVISVEEGTSRSPSLEESAVHLPARLEVVVGAFKSRRNQQVTRAAIEHFLDRAATERTQTIAAAGPSVPAPPADDLVARSLALLDAVDAWLARATMTPEAAQAIHADRVILAAAIGAPDIDEVIVTRATTRLTAALDH